YLHSQDMELWVRLASFGYRFHLLEQKLTIRRVHAAQASTANMIYCRYDAARLVNYYLTRFTLFEVYRYFNPSEVASGELFVQPVVGRTLHAEANVNHPLVQANYWRWLDQGLAILSEPVQARLLARCLELLQHNRAVSAKLDYYVHACRRAL